MRRDCANSRVICSCLFCFNETCRIGGVRPRPWLPLDNFHVHWQTAEIISRMMRTGQFSLRACGARKLQVLRNLMSMDRTSWKMLAESSGQARTLVASHKQTHLVPDINSLFSIRSSCISSSCNTYAILVASRLDTLLIANLRRRLSHKYTMSQ